MGWRLKRRFYRFANRVWPSSVGPPEESQTEQHQKDAKEADLTVLKPQQLLEQAAPACGRHHRHQAFEDKHQANGQQPDIHRKKWTTVRQLRPGPAEPVPRIALKKSELAGSSTITSLFLAKLAL